MRIFFTAWLVSWFFSVTWAAADEQFSLSARLVRPGETNATFRLAIELRNVSSQPQRVVTLTNVFEGHVYFRDMGGDVHEFIQTNYWNMKMTSFYMRPTVEIAPGGLYRWEHALSQFIDSHRLRTERVGNAYPIAFPILSAEFQPGCEIWCTLGIRQWKKFDETHITHERTAIAVSSTLKLPE